MKKLTIRLEDYIYDRLFLVANENNTSANKVVSTILEEYINQPREINYLKEIDEKLKKLIELEEKISKRQYKHFRLSQQHFSYSLKLSLLFNISLRHLSSLISALDK